MHATRCAWLLAVSFRGTYGAAFTLTVDGGRTVGHVDDSFLGSCLGSWDKLAQGPSHHVQAAGAAAGSRGAGGHSQAEGAAPSGGSWPVISCEAYFERDPRLLAYVKELSPGYLRFGDMPYFYAGVGDGDAPPPAAGDADFTTITRACFDRVAQFSKDAGLEIYLLGNTQYGLELHLDGNANFSHCVTDPSLPPAKVDTDWTNLRHLLEHAKRSGARIAAVDIAGEGNDMMVRCPVPGLSERWPHVLANATRRLRKVLAEVYPEAKGRPKLVGPMMGWLPGGVCGISGPGWMETYLKDAGADIDAISYDWYPMDAVGKRHDTAAAQAAIMEPSFHRRARGKRRGQSLGMPAVRQGAVARAARAARADLHGQAPRRLKDQVELPSLFGRAREIVRDRAQAQTRSFVCGRAARPSGSSA